MDIAGGCWTCFPFTELRALLGIPAFITEFPEMNIEARKLSNLLEGYFNAQPAGKHAT
jgi:hypothetical protein